MKRLLLLTGILLIAYVVLMTSTPSQAGERTETEAVFEIHTEGEDTVYLVTERDDRLVVLLNGSEYLRTDTLVSSLPKADQTRIRDGILLTSMESLRRMIEDYCS